MLFRCVRPQSWCLLTTFLVLLIQIGSSMASISSRGKLNVTGSLDNNLCRIAEIVPRVQSGASDESNSLASLLARRPLPTDPIFEEARSLLARLGPEPTCRHVATAQLLKSCKAVKDRKCRSSGVDDLLERAKTVYGARLAICETSEGKAGIPSSCKHILSVNADKIGWTYHVAGHSNDVDEIESIRADRVTACVQALQKQPFYWTSYSNNRQEANTLCRAAALETDRLELLDAYKQLTNILPEFGNVLAQYEQESIRLLELQRSHAIELNVLHDANIQQFKQDREDARAGFRAVMSEAHKDIREIGENLHESLNYTSTRVATFQEACQSFER